MVITPDIYLNVQSMSTGVQYDPSHSRPSIFSATLDHHQWMDSPHHHATVPIKEEPRDTAQEYGQGSQDRMPLTPPYSVYAATAYREGTPPQVTPPASTPSPKDRITPSPKDLREAGCSSSSNSEGEYYESGESLKKLQMALNRSGMITEEKLVCPVCDFFCGVRSQFNEHLLTHVAKCSMCEFSGENSQKLKEHMKSVHNCEDDGTWNEELSTPKVNSQGKVKTFKCKQCSFKAVTKVDFWKHSRIHIKPERLLTCPKCPFVTEYKHHLEYHLRNHFGSKPFKCSECPYTCVNKSMLNSHMKSHSDIYQFGCNNCSYQTKYCHSLKMHLRKYNHTPAMVLNPDGSPNPLPIVDVYGTRRGPRQRPKVAGQQQQQSPMPNLFNPYPMLPAQMPPFFNILSGYGGFPFSHDLTLEERNNNNNNIEKEVLRDDRAPLDLSRQEPMIVDSQPEPIVEDSSTHQEAPVKSRRKGKAFKLDTIALRLLHRSEEEDEEITEQQKTIKRHVVAEPPKSPEVKSCEADSEEKPDKKTQNDSYNCTYCDITFMDIVMYTMHMGYHGYEDPFKCNMCGQQSADKLAFFLHIARTPHL